MGDRAGRDGMTTVESKLLDGLDEGLILRLLEREPATPTTLHERLEKLLGRPPDDGHLLPILADLEIEGRIEARGRVGDQPIYRLTGDGQARLASYRSVTDPLRQAIGEIFGIESQQGQPPPEALPDPPAPEDTKTDPPEAPAPQPDTGQPVDAHAEDWVRRAIGQLPVSPGIEAPFANASLDIEPGADTWTLEVQQHAPGTYDGSDRCPLTFLYGASVRLLYGTYGASMQAFDRQGDEDREADVSGQTAQRRA